MPDQQYEDRTIKVNRVAKVVKGGRRFSFAALMVIGDGQGTVGLGYGKAKEAGLAVQKGIEEARKNLFEVPLAGSTIVHPVIGESGAGRVLLKPAAPGTGVIAGGAARHILEMAGIRDILAKSLGSSNGINVAHATIAGLKQLRRPDDVAALRGKSADEVTPGGVLRASEASTPLIPAQLTGEGLSLGSASFRVIGENECLGALAEEVLTFFAQESCGQCVPCSSGLHDSAAVLGGGASAQIPSLDAVDEYMRELAGRGACRLPDGASATYRALWARFSPQIVAHHSKQCSCHR